MSAEVVREEYDKLATHWDSGTRHIVDPDCEYDMKAVCGIMLDRCSVEELLWGVDEADLQNPDICLRCKKTANV